MIYHVSVMGNDQNAGTATAPFRTINHATQVAVAGDTVQVHEGTYREWVNPKNICSIYDQFNTIEEYEREGLHINSPTKYTRYGQPLLIDGNAYAGHARPFRAEQNAIMASSMAADVEECDGKWILTISIPEDVANASCTPVTTERLGSPRITEEPYENPDGTPIDFTKDLMGATRESRVIPGPFASLKAGEQRIVVWH